VFANLLVGIACALLILMLVFAGRYLPAMHPSFGIFSTMIRGVQLNAALIAFGSSIPHWMARMS
jgi:hypothetical protein